MKNILNFKKITHPCNISPFSHTNTINNINKKCLLCSLKDEKSEYIRVSAGEGCRGER